LIGGNVTFGSAATLQLDTGTSQLGGNIAGAAFGDNIDLRFQAYAAGDKTVWQQNGATGKLMLETAGGTVLQSLTLAGQYTSGEFAVMSDGNNGALIEAGAVSATVQSANGIDLRWATFHRIRRT
jgi:hypothetical protein